MWDLLRICVLGLMLLTPVSVYAKAGGDAGSKGQIEKIEYLSKECAVLKGRLQELERYIYFLKQGRKIKLVDDAMPKTNGALGRIFVIF